MHPVKERKQRVSVRAGQRYSMYRELALTYEGSSQDVSVRAPDVSIYGMFINTAQRFPEGAVLKVHFTLSKTNYDVDVRVEVRYCLTGVGIGVEFIDITPEAQSMIEQEGES